MAKSTTKELGTTARTRAATAAGGSVPVRDRSEEEMRDEIYDGADDNEHFDADADGSEDAVDGGTELEVSANGTVKVRAVSHGAQVPPWAMGNPVTRWIAECVVELSKTTRPTWSEAWTLTLAVVVMSALVAALLFGADFGLQHFLAWVVSFGNK